ncbi:MAG TPA: protein kinase [Promineifilum sp.]|nr:protein kinase [Promineifilum sp.]
MTLNSNEQFYRDQRAFADLANEYASGVRRLVFFCGAGPSKDARLPDWQTLVTNLRTELLRPPYTSIPAAEHARIIAEIDQETSPWRKLSYIKRYMTAPSFEAEVRRQLQLKDQPVPSFYKDAWTLKLHGLITLNLDGLASKGFAATKSGSAINDVLGKNAHQYTPIVQLDTPFIINGHGVIDNPSSWVLTEEDLESLSENDGYKELLRIIFSQSIIVYYGISPSDIAASGALRYLKRHGISTTHNYWLKKGLDAHDFEAASDINVRIIQMPPSLSWADGFKTAAGLLKATKPAIPATAPVYSELSPVADHHIAPDALVAMRPNEIRKYLAGIPNKFSHPDGSFSYDAFRQFCVDYDSAITVASRIKLNPPNNQWLDYTIVKEIGGGVFGRVLEATRETERIALKVAREEVRDDESMLRSFRRGVECMRLLKTDNVPGTSRIVDATEMPPAIVMEYIEGITLEHAVKRRLFANGKLEHLDKLRTLIAIANIVASCHEHPRTILHRDLRPSNVMLTGEWWDRKGTAHDIVVLDFDLSWFNDADEGDYLMKNSVALGYLAPEQLEPNSEFSPRNARVDVFGISALAFFVFAEEAPGLYSIGGPDWSRTVHNKLIAFQTGSWKSARSRLARLIVAGSNRSQADRPSVRAFISELNAILNATEGNPPEPQEYWTEELLARAFATDYEWDDTSKIGTVRFPSGLQLKCRADEGQRLIKFKLSYIVGASKQRGQIAKFLKDRRGAVIDALSKVKNSQPEINVGQGIVDGSWVFPEINDEATLNNYVGAIQKAANTFREVLSG